MSSSLQTFLNDLLGFFSTLGEDIINILNAAINAITPYIPTLVGIAAVSAVAVGVGYAIRTFVNNLPFVNQIFSGLARLIRF